MKLSIQNISKSYGKTIALRDFSAELENGIYALLGPNGSGKSTLMNILSQNLKADSGTIFWDGQNIHKMGEEFRAQLGFMPQYPGLYPTFTVHELLAYIAALKKIPSKKALEQINELLAVTELEEYANRRIGALSGGMKQRLCLAQALLGEPRLLILDEPTAGMDPKQRVNMRNYIARIAEDRIVIIATHLVEDVEHTAHRILLLKKGELLSCASPTETLKAVEGTVWQVVCEREALSEIQRQCTVVTMAEDEGVLTLRVLADSAPSGSVPLVPTLEDCYLYTFCDVLPTTN